MNTDQLIEEVESLGGRILIDVRVQAPKSAMTPELVGRLRLHKQDIIIRKAQSEPPVFSAVTEPEKADAELISEFQANGCIRIEYKGSSVWLVATTEQAECVNDGTVYTMEEWQRIVRLSDNNEHIRMIHDLRTLGGLPAGSVVIPKTESAP